MKLRSKPLALLFVLITLAGTNNFWHSADDVDFGQPAAHSHSAHHERLRARSGEAGGGHCALCHWLQSLRAGWIDEFPAQAIDTVRPALPATALVSHRSVGLLQRSPRAPPV